MDKDIIPMTEVLAIGEKIDSFLKLDSSKQDLEITAKIGRASCRERV